MVSVTCRLTTGVTETAGGGGAPWAAAAPQDAATPSAPIAAFQARNLRRGIGVLLTAGDDFRFEMPPLRDTLHLREAAFHEQFRYRDVALLPLDSCWPCSAMQPKPRGGSPAPALGSSIRAYMPLPRRIYTPVKDPRAMMEPSGAGPPNDDHRIARPAS